MSAPFAFHYDDEILKHATPTQRQYAEAYNRLGSGNAVAVDFNKSQSAVNEALATLRKNAAAAGWMSDGKSVSVPEGLATKRFSGHYKVGKDGKPELTSFWHIAQRDGKQSIEDLTAALQVLAEPYAGLGGIEPAPEFTNSDFCAIGALRDLHR